MLFLPEHVEENGSGGDIYENYSNGDTDYVVLSTNGETIVLVLRIYWNKEWYYLCEDSLTLNAVKAFCRSSFFVDGGKSVKMYYVYFTFLFEFVRNCEMY